MSVDVATAIPLQRNLKVTGNKIKYLRTDILIE